MATTGPQSSRLTSRPTSGNPFARRPGPLPAAPRTGRAPAWPCRLPSSPAGGRGSPSGRGAARERPVSHRPQHGVGRRRPRRQHLPAPPTARGPRWEAPRKFRFSSPGPPGAAGQPTRVSPTRPGAEGGCREGPTRPRPGRRAQTLLAPPPQPPRVCSQRPRAAGAIRTQVTRPPLRSKPTTAAGAGLSPARARARRHPHARRERGHEHTHTARSPPFLACSLAPPGRPRATCSRGRGHLGGHTHLGSRGVGLAPPRRVGSWVLELIECTWDVLPGLPRAGKLLERIVHLTKKVLAKLEEWKESWAPLSPTTERTSAGNSRTSRSREIKALDLKRRGRHLFATTT